MSKNYFLGNEEINQREEAPKMVNDNNSEQYITPKFIKKSE